MLEYTSMECLHVNIFLEVTMNIKLCTQRCIYVPSIYLLAVYLYIAENCPDISNTYYARLYNRAGFKRKRFIIPRWDVYNKIKQYKHLRGIAHILVFKLMFFSIYRYIGIYEILGVRMCRILVN